MGFSLRDLPAAMRGQGFGVGAALMDRWFAGSAWVMPDAVKEGKSRTPAAALETRLVTMSWALRFDRAAAANTRLLNTWATPTRLAAGTVQIEAKLKKWIANLPPASLAKPFRFGDLARRTEVINETCTINIEHVDSSVFGTVDDFYAALGSALFKIAVTGMVERTGKHWRVSIDEVGTFLRDTYDFKGVNLSEVGVPPACRGWRLPPPTSRLIGARISPGGRASMRIFGSATAHFRNIVESSGEVETSPSCPTCVAFTCRNP